jgi:hypothetical protein
MVGKPRFDFARTVKVSATAKNGETVLSLQDVCNAIN